MRTFYAENTEFLNENAFKVLNEFKSQNLIRV